MSGPLIRVAVPGLMAIALLGVGACGPSHRHPGGAATPTPATTMPPSTIATSTIATSTTATSTAATSTAATSTTAASTPPPSAPVSAISATQIVSYSPYVNGNLRPGLHVASTETVDTSAWPVPTSACVRLASGAWDCDLTTDLSPCYPAADQRSCVFVESPWATTAVRVVVPVVPAPLASNPPIPAKFAAITAAHPWAVELTDGRLCHDQLQGAGDWIGTVPLSYSCTPDDAGGETFCSGTADNCLYGYVDRTHPLWTIDEGDQPDCKPGQDCSGGSPDARISGTVTIAHAWFK